MLDVWEMRMNKDNIIKRYVKVFNFCKDANIVVYFHKKTSDAIWKNWLYIAMPVIIFAINLFFMIKANVLWGQGNSGKMTLSYLRDLSNSMGLSMLYFLSYFLSSYFPFKFEEWIEVGISHEDFESLMKQKRKTVLRKKIENIFSILLFFLISFGVGYGFYSTARSNPGIWSHNLGFMARVYYTLFLGVTWYHSLSILGMALSGGAIIYWCIKSEYIRYNKEDYNKNLSITKALDILIVIFSYGLFYIVCSVLFILNDKIAANPPINVVNAFANDANALILIVVVFLIVVLAYIPLHTLMNFMHDKKKELINQLNSEIQRADQEEKSQLVKERNDIIAQGAVSTTFFNKMILILSVVLPLIAVIFQGIELLKK